MIDHVEARLIGWGIWSRRNLDGAAGYPRRTVEARLRDEGGVLISGTGTRIPPVDSDAEQIERIVIRLGDHRPEWRYMLVARYCQDAPRDYIARKLGVSESLLVNKWEPQAQAWIAGALVQIESVAA